MFTMFGTTKQEVISRIKGVKFTATPVLCNTIPSEMYKPYL